MTAAHLKLMAYLSMLIDHIGLLILLPLFDQTSDPTYAVLYNVFRSIGRLAYPLFLFLLQEGFKHTKSRENYLKRLLGFGILSQVPYNLAMKTTYQPNIYFSLAFGLVVLIVLEAVENRFSQRLWLRFLAQIGVIAVACISATPFEYSFRTPLLLGVFHLLNRPWNHLITGILTAVTQYKPYGGLAYLLTLTYNGKKGQHGPSWIYYTFYPVHLLLLVGVRDLLLPTLFN